MLAAHRSYLRSTSAHWEYGLVEYKSPTLPRSWLLTPDADTYTDPVGQPLALSCSSCFNDHANRPNVAPLVMVDYALFDGAEGVHYNFFFVNIAEWRKIDGTIRDLVDGFRQGS